MVSFLSTSTCASLAYFIVFVSPCVFILVPMCVRSSIFLTIVPQCFPACCPDRIVAICFGAFLLHVVAFLSLFAVAVLGRHSSGSCASFFSQVWFVLLLIAFLSLFCLLPCPRSSSIFRSSSSFAVFRIVSAFVQVRVALGFMALACSSHSSAVLPTHLSKTSFLF